MASFSIDGSSEMSTTSVALPASWLRCSSCSRAPWANAEDGVTRTSATSRQLLTCLFMMAPVFTTDQRSAGWTMRCTIPSFSLVISSATAISRVTRSASATVARYA